MALQEELESQGNWLFRYRSLLPLTMLAAGMAVYLITIHTSGFFYSLLQPYWPAYEYTCLLVSLLGVGIRAYTVGHTPAGTSGRNTAEQVAESLNTTGIYSIVRHPLYLGNFLMWLGICLLTCDLGFILIFMLIYWLYYERIMYAEEQFLRRRFGAPYLTWAMHTPPFLPRFTAFAPPALPFSWKKVLKKEKNGIFALLLIFALFDGLRAWIQGDMHFNYLLTALAISSGIAYLILKYIKRHTQWLNEEGR